MGAAGLKSYEFRREREPSWRELEALLDKVEERGVKRLSASELSRLPTLYRAALSSLSVARAISLDKNVIDFLESLAGRAYFCVYGAKRQPREIVAEFFAARLPQTVRRHRWQLLLATAFLLLGAIAGHVLTSGDPDYFYSFVDDAYASGRGPTSTTTELRDVLYHQESAGARLATFASFLFTHNARIGILAFALGFAAGIPVFLLLLVNGMTLGAFGALYAGRGLALDFWGWVLPHGVTELLAVLLCGAAGLVVANALVFPGRRRRLDSLARAGREAAVIVIGAVVMFFLAGLIEGIFRQTVQHVGIRYAVAIVSALGWTAYFTRAGRVER